MLSALRFQASAVSIENSLAAFMTSHIVLWMLKKKLLEKEHTFRSTVQIVGLSIPDCISSQNPIGLKLHSIRSIVGWAVETQVVSGQNGNELRGQIYLSSFHQVVKHQVPQPISANSIQPITVVLLPPEETTLKRNSSRS